MSEEKMHDDKEDWMIKWTDEEKASGLWSVAEMRESNSKRFCNVPMHLNFSKLWLVDIVIFTNTVHQFTAALPTIWWIPHRTPQEVHNLWQVVLLAVYVPKMRSLWLKNGSWRSHEWGRSIVRKNRMFFLLYFKKIAKNRPNFTLNQTLIRPNLIFSWTKSKRNRPKNGLLVIKQLHNN